MPDLSPGQGPTGEVDWIGSWDDSFDLLPEIDTCVLGAGMNPGYEEYWLGVYEHPNATQPLTGQKPSAGEVDYARFARHVPHIVLSSKLETAKLPSTRFARDVSEIKALKEQPGKHIHAVGGAKLVSSLMNADLVDEVRLTSTRSSWAKESRCSRMSNPAAASSWWIRGRCRVARSLWRTRLASSQGSSP